MIDTYRDMMIDRSITYYREGEMNKKSYVSDLKNILNMVNCVDKELLEDSELKQKYEIEHILQKAIYQYEK